MAQKTLPPHKRGDSFGLACRWTDAGVPESVSGLVITSQVRVQGTLKLVADLDVVVYDQTSSVGGFALSSANTAQWPTGSLTCDIRISQDGVIRSSEEFVIPVVSGVTV